MGHNPWRKIWHDRLRSSPKWTRLRTVERGFWFDCFLIAKDDGRLELLPDTPLTPTDLAYEFRNRRDIIEKWVQKLTDVGLMEDRNGFLWLVGMSDLCQMSAKRLPTDCQTSAKPLRKPGVSTANVQKEASASNGLGQRSGVKGAKSLSTEAEAEEEKKKTPPISPSGGLDDVGELPQGFAEWFALYQNKVGKAKAILYWTGKRKLVTGKKANHEPQASKLIAALQAQIDHRASVIGRGEFSPEWKNADSYLYNRRWEDVPSKVPPRNGIPTWHPCHGMEPTDAPRTGTFEGKSIMYRRDPTHGFAITRTEGEDEWHQMNDADAKALAESLQR